MRGPSARLAEVPGPGVRVPPPVGVALMMHSHLWSHWSNTARAATRLANDLLAIIPVFASSATTFAPAAGLIEIREPYEAL